MLKNCSHLISSSQSHRQNVTQIPHDQAILLECTFINIFCVWNVLEQSSEEEHKASLPRHRSNTEDEFKALLLV